MLKPRSYPRTSILATLFLSLSAMSLQAAAPNPPSNVCVNGVCTQLTISTGSTNPASNKAVKWHPGVYLTFIGGGFDNIPGQRWDLSYQRDGVLAFIDSICSEQSVKGVELVALWKTLEGDTPGDYSAGFQAVDAILSKLASCGKYLQLSIQTSWFGQVSNLSWVVPQYIADGATFDSTSGWHGNTGAYGVTNYSRNGVVNAYEGFSARVWQQATADRLVALSAAYAARYNSHPRLETLSLYGESALVVEKDGYSLGNWLSQLKRVYAAARTQWPNTGLKVWLNDGGNDSNLVSLFQFCKTIYCVISNPDTWPADITQSDRIYVGKDISGANVYEDLRGKLPFSSSVQWQSFNMNGDHPRFTLQQLLDVHLVGYTPTNTHSGAFTMPALQSSYGLWYVNYFNGNSENRWDTAEHAFLKAKASSYVFVACPNLYPACNSQ